MWRSVICELLQSFTPPSLPSPKQEKEEDEPRLERHKNENVGEVVAVAVFAWCAAHHLKDVDAFHKEDGDKCFHEDLTRGEKLSYKKSHPMGGFSKSFYSESYFTNTLIEALMSRP